VQAGLDFTVSKLHLLVVSMPDGSIIVIDAWSTGGTRVVKHLDNTSDAFPASLPKRRAAIALPPGGRVILLVGQKTTITLGPAAGAACLTAVPTPATTNESATAPQARGEGGAGGEAASREPPAQSAQHESAEVSEGARAKARAKGNPKSKAKAKAKAKGKAKAKAPPKSRSRSRSFTEIATGAAKAKLRSKSSLGLIGKPKAKAKARASIARTRSLAKVLAPKAKAKSRGKAKATASKVSPGAKAKAQAKRKAAQGGRSDSPAYVSTLGIGELRKGAVVELQGLQASCELNGRRGVIRRYLSQKDRWEVEIEGVGIKRARFDNLKPLGDDSA
jgi:hypothetical protein